MRGAGEGRQLQSFLTSALQGGVVSLTFRLFGPQGKECPVPSEQVAGWALEAVWTFRRQDRSIVHARNHKQEFAIAQSLYLLSFCCSLQHLDCQQFWYTTQITTFHGNQFSSVRVVTDGRTICDETNSHISENSCC